MHYYRFNISDWALHTAHLTLVEEAVYFRLINHYYDSESYIPLETQPVFRRLRLGSDSVIANQILNEFFIKTETGFSHNRCDSILKVYRKTAKKNKVNGAKGGRPKKVKASSETQNKPSGLSVGTQSKPNDNPNQELLTTNQELLTTNHNIKPSDSSAPNSVLVIFQYWCEVMKKSIGSTKLTPKRDKAIRARLKEGYSLEDIKKAIDGCRADSFSMGQNDRQKPFNDIELICRNGEKLESFRDALIGPNNPDPDRPREVGEALRDIGDTDW